MFFQGKDVLRGIQVMKKLKKDAKPVLPYQYKINLYSKEGDFSQAMKDFNSFQPKNVVDCNRSSQVSRGSLKS